MEVEAQALVVTIVVLVASIIAYLIWKDAQTPGQPLPDPKPVDIPNIQPVPGPDIVKPDPIEQVQEPVPDPKPVDIPNIQPVPGPDIVKPDPIEQVQEPVLNPSELELHARNTSLLNLVVDGRPGLQKLCEGCGEDEKTKKTDADICKRGLIAFVFAQNILATIKEGILVDVTHSGTDNLKTWTEYGETIKEQLRGIVTEVDGADILINWISEKIYDEHFKAFPNWPAEGKSQQSTIQLKGTIKKDFRSDENEFNHLHDLYATAEGFITVMDEVKGGRYVTSCQTPTNNLIKVRGLVVNIDALEQLQQRALADVDKARQKCRKEAIKICPQLVDGDWNWS